MHTRPLLSVPLFMLAFAQCGSPSSPGRAVTIAFDFANGAQGWRAGFADYPAGHGIFYELIADYRLLPASLAAGRSALHISSNNHSDDLFMFYKRRVAGLNAATRYETRLEVRSRPTCRPDAAGVGGSPGESVFVKAGVEPVEPTTVADAFGTVHLVNFDKGNQAESGSNALVLGNVANSLPCEVCGGGAYAATITMIAAVATSIHRTASGSLIPAMVAIGSAGAAGHFS